MASYEEYKEKFKDLATLLKEAADELDLRKSVIDLCAAIEIEIKSDIAASTEHFKKYNDLSQIERAIFLGMARDTVTLAGIISMLYSTPKNIVSFANDSINNLISATDLMICERDGKSKWSLYDDVY